MLHKRFRNSVVLLQSLVLLLVLGACGDPSPTAVPATTTAATTTAPTTTTTTTAATTTRPTTVATTTTATTTARATTTAAAVNQTASAKAPVPTLRRQNVATGQTMAGLGKELEGQLIAVGSDPKSAVYFDARVAKVAAYESFTFLNTQYKPKNGAFLLVVYEVANLGMSSVGVGSGFGLFDAEDKRVAFGSGPPWLNLPDLETAFNRSVINPGFVAKSTTIYDVAANATGLKFKTDTAVTRKASAASFDVSGGKGADSSAGQELVGKTGNDTISKQATYKVTKVERLTEVRASDGVLEKADGVYLVIVFEVNNKDTRAVDTLGLTLADGEGHRYQRTDNQYVTTTIPNQNNADTFKPVANGQTGNRVLVFEVPKDVKGFDLK